ncbi:hypothetical protein R69746_06339 [Paraburkholderia aspalathi]|nr:hypothetical protein R69746_06339 [Paraburkholderia aspalathi]
MRRPSSINFGNISSSSASLADSLRRAGWLILASRGGAADLAKLEQRVKHDDVAARESLFGGADTNHLLYRGACGFTQVALCTVEFDGMHESRPYLNAVPFNKLGIHMYWRRINHTCYLRLNACCMILRR